MTAPMRDEFFQVHGHSFDTSAGPVSLPILYFDVSNLIAFFRCSKTAAMTLLTGTGLEPAFTLGKWALVGVSLYEYRKTGVGAYNEVGVALPVCRSGQGRLLTSLYDVMAPVDDREMGFYVVDLPVTTELACAAGRELWGYPKFVTRIPFKLDGRDFKGQVMDPSGGQAIMTLSGRMGPGITLPPLSLLTYSKLQGQLLRTTVDVRGAVHTCLPGSLRLLVGSSTHPMAERLRKLGLHNSKPLLVMATDQFQSRLNAADEA